MNFYLPATFVQRFVIVYCLALVWVNLSVCVRVYTYIYMYECVYGIFFGGGLGLAFLVYIFFRFRIYIALLWLLLLSLLLLKFHILNVCDYFFFFCFFWSQQHSISFANILYDHHHLPICCLSAALNMTSHPFAVSISQSDRRASKPHVFLVLRKLMKWNFCCCSDQLKLNLIISSNSRSNISTVTR